MTFSVLVSFRLTRTAAFDVFGMSEEAKDGMFQGFGSKVPAGRSGLSVDSTLPFSITDTLISPFGF